MRACVLFILFTCWLFGQSADPPEVTRVHVKEEILAADAEFRTTVLHGDATKLATIFADDIIIVHSDGEKDTKKNFLDAIASGRLKMISYERNDIQIRVYGVVAVMFS